ADGFGAGLAVMATGLGKTWLAAFDSARPQFRRVLFVAHREEILSQARAVFRQVHPGKSIGWLGAGRDERGADIVLASVQTLTRRINEFAAGEFDYVVIDEFHHASAQSYRRVIAHLNPGFQLGITATPQRTDNADLLSLCEDNLVFECGLAAGIDRQALSPFRYVGVPDPVDFRPLPWRSSGFDPIALDNAVISAERTEASYREWLARKGQRTLAFAVSVRHSDWLAEQFKARGVRCVSVHSGSTSDPREQSLQRLKNGELDIVFCVDLFNEGVDVPEIDTVLMLRPTQSPVLFLQQIGRGLRRAEGKDALSIIDFVGNHRSFLLPVRLLAGLVNDTLSDAQLATAVRAGEFVLPDGCSVDYELEAKTTILSLLPKSLGGTVVDFTRAWSAERGTRPSALQAYQAGRNPAAGGGRDWFELMAEADLLTSEERRVWDRNRPLLADVAKTSMTKSYKMTALRAMLIVGDLRTGAAVAELSDVSWQLILRDPRLLADINVKELGDIATVSARQWMSYWKRWPLKHLTNGGQFAIDADRFVLTDPPTSEDEDTLEAMIAELVDWRMAAYLDRRSDGRIRMRVSHSDGRPILRFDRTRNPELPVGRGVPLDAGGDMVWADFMKIAVNVVRHDPDGPNALPDLMWQWFGPDAGKPGTAFYVEVWEGDGQWHIAPLLQPDPLAVQRAQA
ncbi:MAG: DEAD/DEAH box helicase, partial [Actinomycetes bacterium]